MTSMLHRSATRVCRLDDLDPETGVAALVDGQAVAVFKTYDGDVFALANYDPFSRASVLARGIVGTRGSVPFVASPMHKQAFDLRTGQCLDDETVRIASYRVEISEGFIMVTGAHDAGTYDAEPGEVGETGRGSAG
ncbi:MAG: nitrite reductase small subunit NirD [Nocardioides sp.]|uniref:nitrite reductase small subunit NirD n=1 Tax=Nocardioides sp. TaxID=35761 RepID=UPI0039E28418